MLKRISLSICLAFTLASPLCSAQNENTNYFLIGYSPHFTFLLDGSLRSIELGNIWFQARVANRLHLRADVSLPVPRDWVALRLSAPIYFTNESRLVPSGVYIAPGVALINPNYDFYSGFARLGSVELGYARRANFGSVRLGLVYQGSFPSSRGNSVSLLSATAGFGFWLF